MTKGPVYGIENDLIEYQDRVIGRLRTALLVKGLSAAEVTRIATDADISPDYHPGDGVRAYLEAAFPLYVSEGDLVVRATTPQNPSEIASSS